VPACEGRHFWWILQLFRPFFFSTSSQDLMETEMHSIMPTS
jgi:hypothetical protein